MKKLLGSYVAAVFLVLLFVRPGFSVEKITTPPPEYDASYYWIFDWLNDSQGDSLRDKFYQVVIVNGEVDEPGPGGELKDDCWVRDLPSNRPDVQERYKQVPGMVDVMITVHYDPIIPNDSLVQVGEKILLRCYDADSMQYAKHYCETKPWVTEFMCVQWANENMFGEWKSIDNDRRKK